MNLISIPDHTIHTLQEAAERTRTNLGIFRASLPHSRKYESSILYRIEAADDDGTTFTLTCKIWGGYLDVQKLTPLSNGKTRLEVWSNHPERQQESVRLIRLYVFETYMRHTGKSVEQIEMEVQACLEAISQ